MDQLISYYGPLRKTLKWYRKVEIKQLYMAMVNAFILYKKVGGTKAQLKFQKSVIASLLSSDIRINEDLPQTSNTAAFRHHKSSGRSRLSGQHYLAHLPSTTSKNKLLESALFAIIKSNKKN